MKPFFCFLFTLHSLLCYSQQKPIEFTDVVKIDSTLKADELYSRARGWFSGAFKSSNEVLQVNDKATGELIGKGSLNYHAESGKINSAYGHIYFTVKVFVKDGRYKYDFTDFHHTGTPNRAGNSSDFGLITEDSECPYKVFTTSLSWKKWTEKNWQEIKNFIAQNIPNLISDFNKAMMQPTSGNNW
jgi:hypothetical protein